MSRDGASGAGAACCAGAGATAFEPGVNAVMRGPAYLRALETALHGAGLPYGYAVTVWSTGAALISARGPPSVGHLFLFAAGAAGAYGGLGS